MTKPFVSKMEAIQKKIEQIEEDVKKKSFWYRIKHYMHLTSESNEQNYLRIQWLVLEEFTHLKP